MPEISGGSISKAFVVVSSTEPQSPFEGQIWVDESTGQTKQWKNSTWEQIQVDVEPIRKNIVDLALGVANNNYQNNLQSDNYDDIFFDIFADETKIATKTGTPQVSTLDSGDSRGKAEMTVSATESSSAGYDSSQQCSYTMSPITVKSIGYFSSVEAYSADTADHTCTIKDSSGNILAEKTLSSTGSGYFTFNFSKSDYSRMFDNEDITIEISVSGTCGLKYRSGHSFTGTYFEYSSVNACQGVTFQTDPVSPSSVESTEKNLSYTPSKVIVRQDANIPTDTDLVYKIHDNSGNTVTVDQTQVGSEVDTSALSDGNISVEPEFTHSDNTKTPTLYEYGVEFV